MLTTEYDKTSSILNFATFNIEMILEDKYQIVREIARGGMGIVYEAHDICMQRKVAIKI